MATQGNAGPKIRQRISTLLLTVLTVIALAVLIGLVVIMLRLLQIRTDLATLHDTALPRLVKLAQLSQEASATSSIAPALSSNPTPSEFETLLSRIDDKEVAQRTLIEELASLFKDKKAAAALQRNGQLLTDNLADLTAVVRQRIETSRRLEEHLNTLRGLLASLTPGAEPEAQSPRSTVDIAHRASLVGYGLVNTLLDPTPARFSRNRKEVERNVASLARVLAAGGGGDDPLLVASEVLLTFWQEHREAIYAEKRASLSDAFRIKALAEENSLIANRLLSSASNAFWRASEELEEQVGLVNQTTRFALGSILVLVLAYGAGNLLVWSLLKRRVFRRLDRIRDGLRAFANDRTRLTEAPSPDEIGEISAALQRYMTVIDQREAELARKSAALEQLSTQLAKYLSPQIYDSIFAGKQEVKLTSSRKKLTVFFSDIAGFTETADRLESEDLTQLLNHYLTEMSRIALDHGATIDKYVGDAILIFFGDPESRGVREDALACVRMAIAMRKRMQQLADIWRESGIERPLRVRTGIHTGFCTVGNFGSEDRLDYTIVGGAVNVAARLETLAAPGEILVSYETFALINTEILCEERGAAEVKGIAYPVATYRVVDSYENLGQERRRYSEQHAHVRLELDLDAMTSDDRSEARRLLTGALEMLERKGQPGEPQPAATSSRPGGGGDGQDGSDRKPNDSA